MEPMEIAQALETEFANDVLEVKSFRDQVTVLDLINEGSPDVLRQAGGKHRDQVVEPPFAGSRLNCRRQLLRGGHRVRQSQGSIEN